jgi:hypothetical protein
VVDTERHAVELLEVVGVADRDAFSDNVDLADREGSDAVICADAVTETLTVKSPDSEAVLETHVEVELLTLGE